MSKKTIDVLIRENLPDNHGLNIQRGENSVSINITTPGGEENFSVTVQCEGNMKGAAAAMVLATEIVDEASK